MTPASAQHGRLAASAGAAPVFRHMPQTEQLEANAGMPVASCAPCLQDGLGC